MGKLTKFTEIEVRALGDLNKKLYADEYTHACARTRSFSSLPTSPFFLCPLISYHCLSFCFIVCAAFIWKGSCQKPKVHQLQFSTSRRKCFIGPSFRGQPPEKIVIGSAWAQDAAQSQSHQDRKCQLSLFTGEHMFLTHVYSICSFFAGIDLNY